MFDNSKGYSINGMYVGSDGHAHISRWSIDNVLYPWKDDNHGFDAYNAEIDAQIQDEANTPDYDDAVG